MGPFICLVVFVLIVLLPCILIYLNANKKERLRKAEKVADEAWLVEEKMKPKYSILVYNLNGDSATSNPFEPKLSYYSVYSAGMRLSSKQVAELNASNIVNGNAFESNGIYYPHHQVKRVEVRKVNA